MRRSMEASSSCVIQPIADPVGEWYEARDEAIADDVVDLTLESCGGSSQACHNVRIWLF